MEKKKQRIIFITLFFLILIAFPIPLIVYNLKNRNPDLYTLRIVGNVSEEKEYLYEDFVDGVYGIIEDQVFTYLNQPPYNTRYEIIYTGVSLWTLLTYTSILLPNATAIYFQSYDLYYTEEISLEKVESNPKGVIIAFQHDNKLLKYNSNDGGPMRAIVNLSVTLPDYCSKYWAKYVNTIVVV
jgi:DMSO/TMAO reductase YedYZ molybdopterin-dependent catalytic subunit